MAGQARPSNQEPYSGLSAGWLALLSPFVIAFWIAVILLILKLLGVEL